MESKYDCCGKDVSDKMRVIALLVFLLAAGCYADVSKHPEGDDEKSAHRKLRKCLKEFVDRLPTDRMARCQIKIDRTSLCLKTLRGDGTLDFMTEDMYQEEYKKYSNIAAAREACAFGTEAHEEHDEDEYEDEEPHEHDEDEHDGGTLLTTAGPAVLIGLLTLLGRILGP